MSGYPILTALAAIMKIVIVSLPSGAMAAPWTNEITYPQAVHLGTEDSYRRDGTLINMQTCLAVADDHSASKLLDHVQLDGLLDLPPLERANALRNLPPPVRDDAELSPEMVEKLQLRPGYGTLLACAQIVAAWHSTTLTIDADGKLSAALTTVISNDGRFEHGAMVIDLSTGIIDSATGKSERGFVEPVSLARILTSPGLLPPTAYGGVVVKNAVVKTYFRLNNLRLTKPLAFVDVKFAGRSYDQDLFGEEGRTSPTALEITSAHLEDKLLFKNVVFCGDILIRESRFADTVAFHDTKQQSIGCVPLETEEGSAEDSGHVVRFHVVDAHFRQSLSLKRSHFETVTMRGLKAENLMAEQMTVGNNLEIVDSDFGAMEIDCSFPGSQAMILRNTIDKDVKVQGLGIEKALNETAKVPMGKNACREWRPEGDALADDRSTKLEISHNQIGGGLSITDFTKDRLTTPLRLASNRVGAWSQIILPGSWESDETTEPDRVAEAVKWSVWQGRIDLQGSSYAGTLKIRLARSPEDTEMIIGTAEEQFCPEINGPSKDPATLIELRAAHVRTLHWDLPLTCDYRWLGYGLTYDLWLKGGMAVGSLGRAAQKMRPIELDHHALMTWRRTLQHYDPTSLDTMSRYLAGKGQYLDSLGILREAKRLNYAPTCRPDGTVFRCAAEIGGKLKDKLADAGQLINHAVASEAQSAEDDGGSLGAAIWEAMIWSLRLGVLFLLWPGGYGAEPYRALLLLAGFFLLCWFIYYLHSRCLHKKLKRAWRLVDPIVMSHLDRETRQLPETKGNPGMTEPPARFDHLQVLAGENGWVWPSENDWAETMTDDERLQQVQGPLLSRIRAWERTAFGDDLKSLRDLRRNLESFGDTDIVGFGRFDLNKMPKRFSHHRFSFDTMVPVIDLHAYNNYYPMSGWLRGLSIMQHVFGWWWVTVFIASAAIL